MSINYQVLRTDILGRPALDGMRAVGDHVGIANFYNTSVSGVNSLNTTLSQTDLLKWAMNGGRYSKITDGKVTGQNGPKSRCLGFIDVIQNFDVFDLKDTQLSGIVVDMVNDGTLTSGDMNAFNKLLIKENSTYSQFLFNANVTVTDIGIALH